MTRRNRNLFVHVLAVAFLFAQFGMLAHASTHLKSDPHGTPAAQLCGECLSFAPLQNMVGGAPTVVLAVNLPHERAANTAAVSLVSSHAFTAFRSRAPPAFL